MMDANERMRAAQEALSSFNEISDQLEQAFDKVINAVSNNETIANDDTQELVWATQRLRDELAEIVAYAAMYSVKQTYDIKE